MNSYVYKIYSTEVSDICNFGCSPSFYGEAAVIKDIISTSTALNTYSIPKSKSIAD